MCRFSGGEGGEHGMHALSHKGRDGAGDESTGLEADVTVD
jgi:hypothetical protein